MSDTTSSAVPSLSDRRLVALARDGWGLEGRLTPLVSYSDQNVRVDAVDGRSFVLKIANAKRKRHRLEAQIAVLEYLTRSSLRSETRHGVQSGVGHQTSLVVPQVLPARSGSALVEVTTADGETWLAFVLTWLPGRLLADLERPSDALLEELGAGLAGLDQALAGLDLPATRRYHAWDLAHALDAREPGRAIADSRHRELLDGALERYRREALPVWGELPSGLIHNDGNGHNVLVDVTAEGRERISGLIDFGDLVTTATVCEPAIAAAYAMLGRDDPWSVAVAILRGYRGLRPLSALELSVFPALVHARLATSVANSAYLKAGRPDDPYLVVNEDSAWKLLDNLLGQDPSFAHHALEA